MARTREQFTSHIWLKQLSTDWEPCTAPVWQRHTPGDSMAWLTARNYLVLCQLRQGTYTVRVYPRLDQPPPSGGRFAARYEDGSLAACLQAAVNDYHHMLAHTAIATFVRHEFIRMIDQREAETYAH